MRIVFTVALIIVFSQLVSAQTDSVFHGIASYYANKFEGRRTASGEIFRQDSLTAAHKNLPFGTLVQVKNLSNDSLVIVKINDRLPQSSKRSIDLSFAAASKLNFIRKGLTRVEITIIPPAVPQQEIIEKSDSTLIKND